MNKVGNWEFDCPQFVDFAAGLDSPKDDAWLGDPENKQRNALCKALGPKMATPKVKESQSLKNSPFVNTSRPVKTDDEKLAVLCKLPRRDSKSDGFLNRPVEHLRSPCNIVNNLRKRSFSANCIRMKKKYPTTPMCLKRTLNNAKSKKGKTTEELELEKISELQNKLAQHLRLNEVNLKRLKKNQAPYPMQNVMNGKAKMKEKQALKLELQEKVQSEQLNELKRNNRKSRFQDENFVGMPGCNREGLNARTLRSRSEKLQSIINSACKTTARQSNALRVVNHANKEERKLVPRKWFPVRDAHCGLKFLPNLDKTVPHPFSFDTSSASSQNKSFQVKDNKANFSTSMWTPILIRDKENIFHSNKFYSARKREEMNFKKV